MRFFVGISCCVGVATAQTGANCDVPCENYGTELLNANNIYSQNVYTIGGAFASPADTIEAVCNISGNDIQTCFVCSKGGQGLSGDASQLTLLDAWWQTCATFQKQGVNNAYACWLSIPSGSGQCAYLASDPDTPQSTTLLTNPAASTSASSSSISPTSISSAASSASQTSATVTPSTSPSVNSAIIQRISWLGSFIGAVIVGSVGIAW